MSVPKESAMYIDYGKKLGTDLERDHPSYVNGMMDHKIITMYTLTLLIIYVLYLLSKI